MALWGNSWSVGHVTNEVGIIVRNHYAIGLFLLWNEAILDVMGRESSCLVPSHNTFPVLKTLSDFFADPEWNWVNSNTSDVQSWSTLQ